MIKNRREIVQFSFCPFYRSAILVQRHGSALLNANNTVFEQDNVLEIRSGFVGRIGEVSQPASRLSIFTPPYSHFVLNRVPALRGQVAKATK